MAQKKEIKRCRPEKAPGRNTSLQATPASLPDARKSGETLGRERERETEKRQRERESTHAVRYDSDATWTKAVRLQFVISFLILVRSYLTMCCFDALFLLLRVR